jgi:hypothetical protein
MVRKLAPFRDVCGPNRRVVASKPAQVRGPTRQGRYIYLADPKALGVDKNQMTW